MQLQMWVDPGHRADTGCSAWCSRTLQVGHGQRGELSSQRWPVLRTNPNLSAYPLRTRCFSSSEAQRKEMYLQEMFILPPDCPKQGSTIPGKKKNPHKFNMKIRGAIDKMYDF